VLHNFVGLVERELELFVQVVRHIELGVFVEFGKPEHRVFVAVVHFFGFLVAVVLERLFVFDELGGGFGFGGEAALHIDDVLLDLLSGVLVNPHSCCVEDLLDKIFTLSNKSFVQLVTLHKEHRHADFERTTFPDIIDCFVESVNLSLEFLTLQGLLVQECVDSLLFVEEEEEVLIDINTLDSALQILLHNLMNNPFSISDQVIIE